MAKLHAYGNHAYDHAALNLNALMQPAFDRYMDEDGDETYNGIFYDDMFWFDDGSEAVAWCGPDLAATGSALTSGTVTMMRSEILVDPVGDEWAATWMLFDIEASGIALYGAAGTARTSDDFSVYESLLSGNDEFRMSSSGDRVRGYAGDDLMYGYRGADRMEGDAGHDLLVGGAGRDTLKGGGGRDVFDYNLVSESGLTNSTRDVIVDFTRGLDRIDLRNIDANTEVGGNQAFKGILIPANAAFSSAGQLRLANGVLYGNTDGDAAAEFSIQLTGVTALAATEFLL
ncbi:MAG: hypothetical protein K0R89_2517 [Ramlibacter sp.]|jgi:hypothetical protein|nr:hypothetical protein [Ramlibacter sp.]